MEKTIKPDINLTERAASHVKSILANKKNGVGLRLAVKVAGCSGFQYVVETAQEIHAHDLTISSRGVTIIIDKHSMTFLSGTTVDFVHKGFNAEFEFDNPNAQNTCGCGESFTITGSSP